MSPDGGDENVRSMFTRSREQVPADETEGMIDSEAEIGVPNPEEPLRPSDVCEHCGAVVRTDHQLLVESSALVRVHGETIIREFYSRLFEAAAHLRPLFPDDIRVQEEKLLNAVGVLATRFDPDDEQSMDFLTAQLTAMGRAHTRFDPAATIEEYATVGGILLGTMADVAGDQWTAAYAGAWRRAYEFAAGTMLRAQSTKREHGRGRRRRP